MTLRSIFLMAPAEVSRAEAGPAAFAVALAAKSGARLTIFCVALDVTSPGPQADAAAVAENIRLAAEARGVDAVVVCDHSHAIGVHEAAANHARLHDLTIGGVDDRGLLSERKLVEHLLFASGRPALLVPADWHGEIAVGTIGLAWDNSRAAARAMADAVQLLAPEQLVVLSVTDDKPLTDVLDPAQLAATLGRFGQATSLVTAELNGRSVGEALQAGAIAHGARVLAMGAFGHSRLRNFVLGSATGDVIGGLRMPVLLSH